MSTKANPYPTFNRAHYKFLIDHILWGERLSIDERARKQALMSMVEAFYHTVPGFDRTKFLEYYDQVENWPKNKPRPPHMKRGPGPAYPTTPLVDPLSPVD